MKGLSTAWSEATGLRVPILDAPMGGVAGGRLAAAVSVAGGLGMIGMGSTRSPKVLEAEVRHPKEAGVSVGIGLIDWAVRRDRRDHRVKSGFLKEARDLHGGPAEPC